MLTFTSPGDFGGTRGKFTPKYWPLNCTQFGLLKKLSIHQNGIYFDDLFVNNKFNSGMLDLSDGVILFEIGIKKNAVHRGGINLFGKNFGNYNQAIVMTIKSERS